MYSNVAYIKNAPNNELPLFVNSCGDDNDFRKDTTVCRNSGRSDYQLLYIPVGQAYVYMDNKEHTCPAGSVILYRPDQPQKYKHMKNDAPESMWVHFSGKDVEKILKIFHLDSQMFFNVQPTDCLKPLFLQLISECQSAQPLYIESASLILQNILLQIARSSVSEKSHSELTDHHQKEDAQSEITKAVKYFNEHYNEKINVNEYAKKLHMSSCWFIRMFKTYANTTPMQYLTKCRIKKAKALLESTNLSIAEISVSVGYSDPLYFSRLFKKNTGLTPFLYRKQNR